MSVEHTTVDDWTLIRQSLPQHHVSSESDYAPGHPALDALTRLEEQLREEQRAFRAYKEHVMRCVEEFAEEVRP